MKRTLPILAVCVVIFGGCNGGKFEEEIPAKIKTVNFEVEDFQFVGEGTVERLATKTTITNGNEFIWTANDTVGIYPNTGSQVYFAMTAGAGAKTAEFDGGGWDFKPQSVYYSYYPFIGDIYLDRTDIPTSYSGQKQIGTTGIDHIGQYDNMYTPGTSAETSMLNFSYKHLNCIIRPNVTLPAGTYTKLAITAPSKVFAMRGHYDLTAETPAIIGEDYTDQLTIDLENVVLAEQTTFKIYLVSAPVNLKDVEIIISVLDSQKKEYQCKKTPSAEYSAGIIGGLTCSSFTEVPQAMGLIIDDWGEGGQYSGGAE